MFNVEVSASNTVKSEGTIPEVLGFLRGMNRGARCSVANETHEVYFGTVGQVIAQIQYDLNTAGGNGVCVLPDGTRINLKESN